MRCSTVGRSGHATPCKIDDTPDLFPVQGVGGIIATIGALTVLLVKVVVLITPLRIDRDTEADGLDLSVHDERTCELTS